MSTSQHHPLPSLNGQTWKQEPIPEAFQDHVQIHQVGDDVRFAIVQGLQGLVRKQGQQRRFSSGMKRNKVASDGWDSGWESLLDH